MGSEEDEGGKVEWKRSQCKIKWPEVKKKTRRFPTTTAPAATQKFYF